MSGVTVSFTTLGCRLNQAESDSMADDLARAGVRASNDRPDIVVVNTCTVTREATKASRMALRRAARDNPSAKVVAIGCYAVSDPDEVSAIEGVDVVLGNDAKERLPEILGATPPTAPLLQIQGLLPADPRERASRVRSNLKVQTGCDEWCTFCIIPRTRGPLRSMQEDALVEEARAKAAAGARELILTGVHLGKYAFEKGGGERDLVRLLTHLLAIPDIARIRLSSILSRHLTDELLDLMATERRICRHLHVPLQSGDDGVLARMNRPYDVGEYLAAVERAANALPGLALATDVIVGFPGETDSAFEATMDVVRRVRFSKLHVFRHSARPETPAASMPDEITPAVKKDRSKRLIDLGNELRRDFLTSHLGRPLEVLVEDERWIDGVRVASGQTDDYVRVWFEGSSPLGEIVSVAGERVRADGIHGREVLRV